MGYASAMAIVLLVVAFAFTAVIIRRSRRWVHYQGGDGTIDRHRRAGPARRRPPAGAEALLSRSPTTAC